MIDSVRVEGNKKTRDQVILREIPFTFPDSLNEEDILYIQNRIQNLFLFNQVQISFQQENPKTVMGVGAFINKKSPIVPSPLVGEG